MNERSQVAADATASQAPPAGALADPIHDESGIQDGAAAPLQPAQPSIDPNNPPDGFDANGSPVAPLAPPAPMPAAVADSVAVARQLRESGAYDSVQAAQWLSDSHRDRWPDAAAVLGELPQL